jgi:hypothetical protein
MPFPQNLKNFGLNFIGKDVYKWKRILFFITYSIFIDNLKIKNNFK